MVGFACTTVEADTTVAITRMEHTATELRRYAACSADASVARRLLALALVLDGHKREDAARSAGMDRQTLCNWVHRYNADGFAGLGDRYSGGAPSRLSPDGSVKNLGRYAASWIAGSGWPKRPSSTAALT